MYHSIYLIIVLQDFLGGLPIRDPVLTEGWALRIAG